MKNWTRLMLSAALALPLAGGALAEDKAKPAKPAEPAKDMKAPAKKEAGGAKLTGHWAMVSKALNFDDATQAKLAEKTTGKSAALKAWEEQNKGELEKLEAAKKAAAETKDKAKIDAAEKPLKELREKRKALDDKWDDEILTVLTPAQRAQYAGYNAYTGAARHFGKVKLTDEQDAKLKAIYVAAGADFEKAADAKAKRALTESLQAKAEKEILTEEQRKAMSEPAPKKPEKPAPESKKGA